MVSPMFPCLPQCLSLLTWNYSSHRVSESCTGQGEVWMPSVVPEYDQPHICWFPTTFTAKNERFPKFASTGNLTGKLMFQGVRYLRMCIIPITFPEKLGNVYGNVLECCPFLCFFFPEISDFYLISVTRNLRKLNFFFAVFVISSGAANSVIYRTGFRASL